MRLAVLYEKSNQIEKATVLLRQIFESSEDRLESFTALTGLARLLVQEEQYEEAAILYSAEIEDETDPDMRATLLWGMGSVWKDAVLAAEDPELKDQLNARADVVLTQCIEILNERIEEEVIEEKRLLYVEKISQVYTQMGKTDEAGRFLQDYLEANPESQSAWQGLGPNMILLSLMDQDYDQARSWAQRIGKKIPGPEMQAKVQEWVQSIDQMAATQNQAPTTGTLQVETPAE
ncbi:hypothetical protein HQ520_01685 [bacterium]|nr:hypothetical protein [bacterium]